MFIRSTDRGQNWSNPVRVNDDATTGWQWFGTLSVAPNGRIDVIWADTRNDPGGFESELYYSYSRDAGDTWSANEPLSPPFDPHLGWPQQNKLGDYYDLVSDNVGADLAYAATFNGEQDVYFLRIGDYDCNGNGVGDTGDVAGGTSLDLNGNGIPDECEGLGDLDGDGDVDLDDFNLFAGCLMGPEVAYPQGCDRADLDGEGDVDLDDFAILQEVFAGASP